MVKYMFFYNKGGMFIKKQLSMVARSKKHSNMKYNAYLYYHVIVVAIF